LINIFNQDINFVLNQKEVICNWILDTFLEENILKEIELSIIFCSDNALLEINKQFLNHDYYTDIITFPIEETNTIFEAELYISIDRVKENATTHSKTFENELSRVIIHGVLHLCGFGDKTASEIKIMRAKEDYYLTKLS